MAFDNSDFVNLLNFYKENDNFHDIMLGNLLINLVKYLNQTMMQEHLKIH